MSIDITFSEHKPPGRCLPNCNFLRMEVERKGTLLFLYSIAVKLSFIHSLNKYLLSAY